MTIGNRALQGQPTLPSAQAQVWAGNDMFVNLTWLDRFGNQTTPLSIQLEIDDMTNAQVMLCVQQFNPAGASEPPIWYPAFAEQMTVQIPGSIMSMSYPYQGSQIVQFAWSWTYIDPVTGQTSSGARVDTVELCAIATVTGSIGVSG
jgi:hypothetical protein